MALPDLIEYTTEDEYKNYYIEHYCNASPIDTFDSIPVMFYPETFEHAFYKRTEKSWKAPKDSFSKERGERLDWIKCVLQDPTVTPRKGYDKATGSYDNTRRVTFINEQNYVVVIYINKKGTGKFVTAYIVDNEKTAEKIRNSPLWEK
ncbi:MAG: hypothetical protein WBJ13_04255 [Sedimentibacter sp.]